MSSLRAPLMNVQKSLETKTSRTNSNHWRCAMIRWRKTFELLAGVASALFAASLLIGCSQTTGASPNVIQRAEGETPAAPAPTGFLGSDYSLLQPAAANPGQKAALAYTNPNANFASYHAIIIDPVTYWADSDSSLSADQQQILCDYFYTILEKNFSQNFTVVKDPGPG